MKKRIILVTGICFLLAGNTRYSLWRSSGAADNVWYQISGMIFWEIKLTWKALKTFISGQTMESRIWESAKTESRWESIGRK